MVSELDKLYAGEDAGLMTRSVDVDIGAHLDTIANDDEAGVQDG